MNAARGDDGRSDLLLHISHCPVVVACKQGMEHPCSTVVSVQQDRPLSAHQMPEPWTGHLDSAVIVFVSSNPSISDSEHYPTWDDDPESTNRYFTNRLDGGVGQVKDGIYPPQIGGGWGKSVSFWSAVRARAREVLDAPVPGTDYVLTEVVHCKSRHEIGVEQARDSCAQRYLPAILDQACRVALVVLYGKHARIAFNKLWGLHLDDANRHVSVSLKGGRHVRVVALDHPAGGGKVKKLATALNADDLRDLADSVSRARSARDRPPKDVSDPALLAAWPAPATPLVLARTNRGVVVLWTWSADDVQLNTGSVDWEDIFGDEIPYYAWHSVEATIAWAQQAGWQITMYRHAYGAPVMVDQPPESPRLPERVVHEVDDDPGDPPIVGVCGDLAGPRPWDWTPRSPRLLGDVGPWTWAMPDLFTALADPQTFTQRPRYRAVDDGAEPIALWSALLTLCWGVFGWPNPTLGLSRWLAARTPVHEPAAQVLGNWWGADTEALIHWNRSSAALHQHSARVTTALEARLPQCPDTPPRTRPLPAWASLLEGGHDPCHLDHVVDHLVGDPAMVIAPLHDPAEGAGQRAVLQLEDYGGWYKALHMAGSMLPPRPDGQSWHVDLAVHSLPTVRSFTLSPVTGRWHATSHRWHLLGYPL